MRHSNFTVQSEPFHLVNDLFNNLVHKKQIHYFSTFLTIFLKKFLKDDYKIVQHYFNIITSV